MCHYRTKVIDSEGPKMTDGFAVDGGPDVAGDVVAPVPATVA
jgi:hypothetical protein